MRKHFAAGAVLTAALLAGAGAEAATVVDFNEFKHDGGAQVHGRSVVSKGFSFTAGDPQGSVASWGSYNNADPGGATLVNWNTKLITVQRTDGELFSLASLDLADTYDAGAAASFLFTLFDGVTTTTQTVTLDRLKGLQTVTFDLGRVSWFSYYQLGDQGVQIDNLVVGAPVVSAVPEPATWAMMILGLGGVGAAMRSRRRQGLATA